MKSLKNFIKKNQSKNISNSIEFISSSPAYLPTLKSISNIALLSTKKSITKSDAEKFSNEAIQIAGSDEVIDKLSNKVGRPLENESEDEFVDRAKSALKEILKEKLFK